MLSSDSDAWQFWELAGMKMDNGTGEDFQYDYKYMAAT